MYCGAELASAAKAVKGVGVQPDAPGRLGDRNQIGGNRLIRESFERCK
jgi:hypothetical protein